MTAVWGPLGWLTLHSVATSYSETPTESERALMDSWLNMFRDTITCASCRAHFTELLAKYRALFPNMLYSRQEFAMFSFRAHNAVNARLMKPIYGTLDECLSTLRKATEHRPARDYRISYINHIRQNWSAYRDVSGIAAVRKILEMRKVETDYVGPRDTKFQMTLIPDLVVLPTNSLSKVPEATGRPRMNPRVVTGGGFRLTSTGFRLQR